MTDNIRDSLATGKLGGRLFGGLVIATAVVEFGALGLGWWWVTVLVGLLVAGLVPGRGAVLAVLIGTASAWALSLLWQSGSQFAANADVIGAIAFQVRDLGWVVLVATLVYALLLALCGLWLGGAGRRLLRAGPAPSAGAPTASAARLTSTKNVEEDQHV